MKEQIQAAVMAALHTYIAEQRQIMLEMPNSFFSGVVSVVRAFELAFRSET